MRRISLMRSRFGNGLKILCAALAAIYLFSSKAQAQDELGEQIELELRQLRAEVDFLRDQLETGGGVADVRFEDLQRRITRANCATEIKSRTLKLRFDDFSTTTVSRAGQAVDIKCFRELLDEAWQRKGLPIRLLGIGVQLKGSSASNPVSYTHLTLPTIPLV